MNHSKYKALKAKYGRYASWAIYDGNCTNYSDIDSKINQLNPKYVFCALNAARKTDNDWEPFHIAYSGGKAEVLRKVLGESQIFKGSYLTDLIKGCNTKRAKTIIMLMDSCEELLKDNLAKFVEEMSYFKVGNKYPKIFSLGKDVQRFFKTRKELNIFDGNVIPVTHYAAQGKHSSKFANEIRNIEKKIKAGLEI